MAEQIEELMTQWENGDFSQFGYLIEKTKMIIRVLFNDEPDFKGELKSIASSNTPKSWLWVQKSCLSLLKVMQEQLEIHSDKRSPVDSFQDLSRVFDAFHNITKQLRIRRKEKGESRPTLNVKDEYDVQDLLHSLLHLYFEDIRPEEWTPSYAGGAVRMDFLLKNEKIVIEVKRSRDSMTAKDLGEQLIIDIEKYQQHSDCKRLICFIYDPEGYIPNPRGIESDLNRHEENFEVKVFIKPN